MQTKLHPPRISNMRQVFQNALIELGKPYPAIQLPRWGLFNKFVGGFRMREYTILCGPTGVGKTTFLANISEQLIDTGVKHFVMSIETGANDYMKRILSVREGDDLNTGEAVSVEKLAKVSARNAPWVSKGMIEFSEYESRIDVEQLKHEIRYAVEQLDCKIVFVDNLNFLLRVTRSNDQIVEMDRVTHDLIEFVKSIDVHILMVMHPRKTEGGRVVSEFDIKGSSTSVQEAQNVFLLNPPTAGEVSKAERNPQDRELTFKKMRRRGHFMNRSIVFTNKATAYSEESYK